MSDERTDTGVMPTCYYNGEYCPRCEEEGIRSRLATDSDTVWCERSECSYTRDEWTWSGEGVA